MVFWEEKKNESTSLVVVSQTNDHFFVQLNSHHGYPLIYCRLDIVAVLKSTRIIIMMQLKSIFGWQQSIKSEWKWSFFLSFSFIISIDEWFLPLSTSSFSFVFSFTSKENQVGKKEGSWKLNHFWGGKGGFEKTRDPN